MSIILIGGCTESDGSGEIIEFAIEPGDESVYFVVSVDREFVLSGELHVFLLHLDQIQLEDLAVVGVYHVAFAHVDQGLLHHCSRQTRHVDAVHVLPKTYLLSLI